MKFSKEKQGKRTICKANLDLSMVGLNSGLHNSWFHFQSIWTVHASDHHDITPDWVTIDYGNSIVIIYLAWGQGRKNLGL